MSMLVGLTRPAAIDAAVRSRLADSLAHIVDRAGPALKLDPEPAANALDQIRSHRVDPGIFARYYDIVWSIGANDLTTARQLLDDCFAMAAITPEFAVQAYAPDQLASDYDRFSRLLFNEFSDTNPMAAPDGPVFAAAEERLCDAGDAIARIDPQLAEEIAELFVRIVCSTGSREPGARLFSSVTSFMVWGATFVNIASNDTLFRMTSFLVHEVTHALLLGLNSEQQLVLNPPDEAYASPLREDRRPMDGIYHATIVCARLVEFVQAWLDSTEPPEDVANAERSIVKLRERYRLGMDVINRHGQLSDFGRHLLDLTDRSLAEVA